MRLAASIIIAARVDGLDQRPFVDPVAEWIVDRLQGTEAPKMPVTAPTGDLVDCAIAKDTLRVELLATGEPVVRFEIEYEGPVDGSPSTPTEIARAAAVSEAAAQMFGDAA
jgi:hypothetical protein